MYRWLAKVLFAGWIVSSVYGGAVQRADWSVRPAPPAPGVSAVPEEIPDPGVLAKGAEKIAREAQEQAKSREFGDLTGSLAALALYTWDKMTEASARTFAPGQPLPRRPTPAEDEVTIAQAVGRMRALVSEAAEVAVEASQVVSRRYPQGGSIGILEYPGAGDNAAGASAPDGR